MKREVKRSYQKVTEAMSDENIVASFLTGYVDYYSGGQLERLQNELENLRTGLTELLVQLHGKKVVDLCVEERV